jgi:hypothetical protein
VKWTATDSEVLGNLLHLAVGSQGMGPSTNTSRNPSDPGISDESIEIMRLVSAGHSNAEIARLSVLSVSGEAGRERMRIEALLEAMAILDNRPTTPARLPASTRRSSARWHTGDPCASSR